MVGAGIHDGDILVVNRALVAQHRDVVVAEVDGDFTVKYLYKRAGKVKLLAADATFPEIVFKDGQTLKICAAKIGHGPKLSHWLLPLVLGPALERFWYCSQPMPWGFIGLAYYQHWPWALGCFSLWVQ